MSSEILTELAILGLMIFCVFMTTFYWYLGYEYFARSDWKNDATARALRRPALKSRRGSD